MMETQAQYKTDNNAKYTQVDLQLVINAVSRLTMARVLQGQTAYKGDRDYYQVLGYPASIGIEDYVQRYERQDIASRIVDLPAIDSFKEPPKLSEADVEETPFVQEFNRLDARLKVWNTLTRADRLSGIGRFGIILIGFKDGRTMVESVNADEIQGEKSILYLRPLSEVFVKVKTIDRNSQSPRFGLPEVYSVELDDNRGSRPVHWSRVIHLAENKLDNEVFGVPRLRSVFNLLDDKIKAGGGTAEATWLNMRPGTAITTKDDWNLEDTTDARNDFLAEVDRYAHDPLRFLRLEGVEATPIGTSEVANPTGIHDVIIADIAAATGIPQRVLVGSAGGELSAAKEDTRQWASTIANRQKNYAEPEVVRPFIDRLVGMGALPTPAGGPGAYSVGTLQPDGSYAWPSIIELDETEKAAATRDQAIAAKALADPTTGELPIDEDEARQILRLPPKERTPQDELEDELTQAILNGRRNGRVTDEALIANALTEQLERMGELDEE
jgi:hypothetical protein